MEKTLKAWRPYDLGLKCCNKLDSFSDIGQFADWDVYWLSAISSVRAVWHILNKQDLIGTDLKLSIKSAYNESQSADPIFQEFVRNQRNRTLKDWIWDVISQDFMSGNFLSDAPSEEKFSPTHKSLVFEYSNPEKPVVNVDENLQGEDPIRLLYISLERIYEYLSKIEISIATGTFKGFYDRDLSDAYHNSILFEQAPKYYR